MVDPTYLRMSRIDAITVQQPPFTDVIRVVTKERQ